MLGATLGKDLAGLLGGVSFTTLDCGEALFDAVMDGLLLGLQPSLFVLEEIEGMVDEFGGLAVGPAGEALDTLFGCGIEGEAHGGSIADG